MPGCKPEHYLPEHYLPEHYLPEHYLPEHYLPEHYLKVTILVIVTRRNAGQDTWAMWKRCCNRRRP